MRNDFFSKKSDEIVRKASSILKHSSKLRQCLFLARVALFGKIKHNLSMQSQYRYFPKGNPQTSWGLFVACAGKIRTEPGAKYPSYDHPDEYYFSWEHGRILHEWQLILIETGRGEAEFNGRRFALKPGMLLILPPGCWHRYRPDSATGWTTQWVGFGGDMATRIMAVAGFDTAVCSVENLTANAAVRNGFATTIAGMVTDGGVHAFSAAARLHLLIAMLAEKSIAEPGNAEARRRNVVFQAQTYLTEHCAEIVDYEALAESLGVPYRTFRHFFTAICGVPPHRYQLLMRIERAKRLLESSNTPVARIASSLGFRSAWHFAHFFQREIGCSAMQYRQLRRTKGYQPMESGPE